MRLQKIGLSPLAKLTVNIATLLATISASFPLSSQVPLAVSREVASSQTPDQSEADNLLNPCREHLRAKQYEAALESCQKALDTYRKTKNRLGEAKALNNLGNAYFALENYSKAIDYHQQSLTIAREIKERTLESKALNNLGDDLLIQGIKEFKNEQLQPALQSLQQALTLYQEVGNRERQSITLFKLGFIYICLKEINHGIDSLKQALAIAEGINDSTLASAAK